jgi:DNA-binding transcriptional regulator GbsR (MarR family)
VVSVTITGKGDPKNYAEAVLAGAGILGVPRHPALVPSSLSPPSAAAPVSGAPLTERHREAVGQFVTLWGEMASSWGINRTMAQIHALLFVSDEPLHTDAIMEHLQISRGNANMNLRALLDWNLIWRSNIPGSRKDFYQAEKDVWAITTTIIRERQRQEIQPVQDALDGVASTLRAGDARLSPQEAAFAARLDELASLMRVFAGVSAALLPLVSSRNARHVQRIIQFATSLRSDPGDEEAGPPPA